MSAKVKKDPKRYREMSVPHASIERANEALAKFFEGIDTLREENQISDIQFVIGDSYIADGEEIPVLVSGGVGDFDKAEAMLAYGLGKASADRKTRIGKALKAGGYMQGALELEDP